MNADEIQETLLKSVEHLVKEECKTLPFLLWDTGVITDVKQNFYKVKINNTICELKSLIKDRYEINDIVLVLMMNNNKSEKYILCKKP